jgi:purine-binding chemotaxis protein CheW
VTAFAAAHAERTASAEIQAIVFRLADEVYGIEIGFVHEIIRHQAPTRVPGSPAEMLGLINLRSRVIPVLSLAAILGGPDADPAPATRIVIVGVEGARVGLVVDEVFEVRTLDAGTVAPAPAFAADGRHHAAGVAQTDRGLVVLLDIEDAVASVDLGQSH